MDVVVVELRCVDQAVHGLHKIGGHEEFHGLPLANPSLRVATLRAARPRAELRRRADEEAVTDIGLREHGTHAIHAHGFDPGHAVVGKAEALEMQVNPVLSPDPEEIRLVHRKVLEDRRFRGGRSPGARVGPLPRSVLVDLEAVLADRVRHVALEDIQRGLVRAYCRLRGACAELLLARDAIGGRQRAIPKPVVRRGGRVVPHDVVRIDDPERCG